MARVSAGIDVESVTGRSPAGVTGKPSRTYSGFTPRTTWIKQKRVRAYGFKAVTESGGGPPSSGEEEQAREESEEGEPDEEEQRRLTLVAEGKREDIDVDGGSTGEERKNANPDRGDE